MLVHRDFNHLASNLIMQVIVSSDLEAILGLKPICPVYLGSA